MSGALSAQIAEALRTYNGPLDAKVIIASAQKRRLDWESRCSIERHRKELENKAFSALIESAPQVSGWAFKERNLCQSKRIICLCADKFGFSYSNIISHRRWDSLVIARQTAMWLLWKTTKYSYPKIGKLMDRDHSTIIHGVRRVDEMMAKDAEFRERVEAILREVTEALPSDSE